MHRKFLMEQSYATLFALVNKLQMNVDSCLSLLTSRQLMAMIAIIHLPNNQATLKNVSSKLGNSKQSTKHIISSLIKKGYIIVTANTNDGRSVNYVLTDEGKNALLIDAMKGYDFFDVLFNDFTNSELDVLWRVLQKLYRFDGNEHDGFEEAAHLGDE